MEDERAERADDIARLGGLEAVRARAPLRPDEREVKVFDVVRLGRWDISSGTLWIHPDTGDRTLELDGVAPSVVWAQLAIPNHNAS